MAMYRQRRKLQPNLPASMNETIDQLSSYDLQSSSGERMLHDVNPEDNIFMFTTESNLKFLCGDIPVFGDGTFTYCPRYFYQLYTLHGYKNGQYVCIFPITK